MANTSYPCSETEYSGTAPQPVASQELNYVQNWVTVGTEISRGEKLRQQKALSGSSHDKMYNVVKIDFGKVAPPSKPRRHSPRKRIRRQNEIQTNPCSPCSLSPFSVHSPSRTYTNASNDPSNSGSPGGIKAATESAKKCPLRIAELAVPTKRQCLNTWRNKTETLPGFMVERLKQNVMDTKPVAVISDAIECFKRRKFPSSVRSHKRFTSTITEKKKQHDMMEIRNLCALFGHNIAKTMITPLNLTLDAELQKISKVVAGDIAGIIKSREGVNCEDICYKRIHNEMANKVTIWIASIMEDASYKLLEEDLKVKQNTVETKLGTEHLVTLIENHILSLQHHRGSAFSELEEEEGPVLDMIDSLVDNVVNICASSSGSELEYDDSYDNFTGDTGKIHEEEIGNNMNQKTEEGTENAEETYSSAYDTGDLNSNIEATKMISQAESEIFRNEDYDINQHFRRDIDKMIDKITGTHIESDRYDTKLEGHNNTFEQPLDENAMFDSVKECFINEELKLDNLEVTNALYVESTVELQGTEEQIKDLLNNIINEANFNVSDVYVILAEEPLQENEKNKKVKFSDIDLVARKNAIEIADPYKNSDEFTIQNINNSREQISWTPSMDQIKPHLIIGPPNKQLLSYIDESWPDDIVSPMLKVSESVSKSVTSLGRILESDEKSSAAPDDIQNNKINEDSIIITELDFNDNTINSYNRAPVRSNRASNTETNKILNEINMKMEMNQSTAEVVYKIVEDNARLGKTVQNKTESTLCTPKKNLTLQIKNEVIGLPDSYSDVGKGDYNDSNDEKDAIFEAVQQKMKEPYVIAVPKFDYRVHPSSAPFWAIINQPSEDSLIDNSIIMDMNKIKENDIHRWCRDLEEVLTNLEQWNGWIGQTCKKIMLHKQKEEVNMIFATNNAGKADVRDWVKLKKNIDKDAVLWKKLHQRTQQKLRTVPSNNKKPKMGQAKHFDQQSIFETLDDIDRQCLWMHRLITSTEYCMKCNCKHYSRRNKKPELVKIIGPSPIKKYCSRF